MPLFDSFLLEAVKSDVWVALRSDQIRGDGSPSNAYYGGLSFGRVVSVSLTRNGNEALADSGSLAHGLTEGDMIQISGVTGNFAPQWNRMFAVYEVTATSFKFGIGFFPGEPAGSPTAALVTFQFDKILRDLPAYTRVNLGPGTFQTRGFAPGGVLGFTPKSGLKLVGAGVDVTVLQLVGASVADQHYHAIGMPIVPIGQTPVTPLETCEISAMTIDCNLDAQPLRGQSTFTPVACGAVRIIGNHCRIHGVKAINWGTKSLRQGGFVLSLIAASGEPDDVDGNPILTETVESGIEDCIAVQPSQNCVREVTVLHIGGRKNSVNQAQGFGRGLFIRRNFVDCSFLTADQPPNAFSSAFISSADGTSVDTIHNVGTFVGKRPHFRPNSTYCRFYNPRNPDSVWNGYYQVISNPDFERDLTVIFDQAGDPDSSLVILGTEFRAIAVTSCLNAVVEQNQIHNCWIGGPYQSPLDDSITQPHVPPDLATEERFDPLNALNTRSLIVKGNTYRNVAVGPYFNMGGFSGAFTDTSIIYFPETGLVNVYTLHPHKLWVGARVKIESAPDPRYEGVYEITDVVDSPFLYVSRFSYQLAPGLDLPIGNDVGYRVVSGVDYLVIENNQIQLLDLDETEFAIKEYPLASSALAQTYRAYGIVVADNGLSILAGPHAHLRVRIGKNMIGYANDVRYSAADGFGLAGGGGMQLAGIAQLQVTHNALALNAPNPLRTLRCGTVRFFNNQKPGGAVIAGWKWDVNGHYDEPATLAEDAFILRMLHRKKR